VKRGEIWLVELDPSIGGEIQKTRPCVVVSPVEMNDYLRTVLIAPMTTKGWPAPYRVALSHGGKKGLILLDQIRAADKSRFVKRVGAVSPKLLTTTLKTLQEVFAE
jgi:mRNA interferase MazF